MLQVVPVYDGQTGWRGEARRVDTLATRESAEGPGRAGALPLAELPAGTMLGSVVASPDGTHVLYTELISPEGKAVRSRMRLLNSDGTPAGSLPSDGQHLDVMPSFTTDGSQIVFTSNRSGEGLDVWRMPAAGPADPKRIARGGEKAALWPMIDASPRPRLFYEEFLKPGVARTAAGASEIHMVELEADPPTNMALAAGTRPRASPRADAVVFTVVDPDTGNRDLYLVSDADGVPLGGEPVNLTNTPDVDETDPAWSRTGGKIAYASNAGADETNRRNYDLYVLTVSAPERPVRVTYNGSLDDSPAWDATGKSLYFRSNRGGKWGIWKAPVP
jgi:Tol biopolymer transport system component